MEEKKFNARTYVTLDFEREGRIYVFSIPFGSPYSEAEEIALGMVEAVREMARAAKEQADKAAAAAAEEQPTGE